MYEYFLYVPCGIYAIYLTTIFLIDSYRRYKYNRRSDLIEFHATNCLNEILEHDHDQTLGSYIARHANAIIGVCISQFGIWNDEYWSDDISINHFYKRNSVHLKLMKPTFREPLWFIIDPNESHPTLIQNDTYQTRYENKT